MNEEFRYYLKFRYDNAWPKQYEAEAKKAHAKNTAACQKAMEEYEEKDRPIRILMIHGSGRHQDSSCAHEMSNSKMLAEYGLDAIRNEDDVEIESVDLAATKLIERCNACFLDPNVKVFGLKKWRNIGEIKKHKGTFPTALNRNGKFDQIIDAPRPNYTGNAYEVTYKILNKEYTVTVTADHKFFDINGVAIETQDLTTENKLCWIGLKCAECGRAFQLPEKEKYDYTNLCCSVKCRGKYRGKQEGAKRKGKTYEEMYGTDHANQLKAESSKRLKGLSMADRFGEERAAEIIEKAVSKQRGQKRVVTDAMREANKKRRGIPLKPETIEKLKPIWESRKGIPRREFIGDEAEEKLLKKLGERKGKTYEEMYGTETAARMRKIVSANKKGKTYEEMYGVERAKNIKTAVAKARLQWQKEHRRPWTELTVENRLEKLGVPFKGPVLVGGKVEADFIVNENLALQIEGCYWHACDECFSHIENDKKYFLDSKGRKITRKRRRSQEGHRDRYLVKKGFIVEKIWEHDLKNNPEIVDEIVQKHASNHHGKFKQYECEITKINKFWVEDIKTYCLTMRDDPSFVIDGGLASHNCVSSTSSLCGFPCDCFTFDGMQELYPKFLRSDIYFFSTGVYQDTMHGLLTNVVQRLISLDGGFLRDEYRLKSAEFKEICIKVSKDHDIEYNARLYGRVCAYFISSKDQNNPSDIKEGINYAKDVATQLKVGFDAYDCHHADPWYAEAASKWDEDYCYDKARLQKNTSAQEKAQEVVLAALELVRGYRKSPKSKAKPFPGRMNRT